MTSHFQYVSAVLQRPGRVAESYFTNHRQRINPALVLLALVGLATFGMMSLQAYHPAWAIIRQSGPLKIEQLTQLSSRIGYGTIYPNIRHLLLIPLYALPTWLVYRDQRVRYRDAMLMHVLWNTAHTVYSLLLFGAMAIRRVPTISKSNGLALVLMVIYLIAVGRTALDLRWAMAVAKAIGTGLLVVLLLRLLTCVGI
jgi:hypothetical protein